MVIAPLMGSRPSGAVLPELHPPKRRTVDCVKSLDGKREFCHSRTPAQVPVSVSRVRAAGLS